MMFTKEHKNKSLIILILLVLITISSIYIGKYNIEKRKEKVIEEKIEIVPYKDYDWSKLTGTKRLHYEDDEYTSIFGIDVSSFQDKIDWATVKKNGVNFAYIRIGYRGAVEGKLNLDKEFERNYEQAIENGIKVGVYWYSQPISKQEAIEEADYVIDVLNNRHLDLPVVYDFEETELSDGTTSRIHGMTRQNRTTMAEAFCLEMKNNGYDCMIYTNLSWSKTYYDWSRLQDYPIWFAQYETSYPKYDRPFVIWQYTDEGTIGGIDTYVDFNIMFIRKNDQN